jgi:hypothetical protein
MVVEWQALVLPSARLLGQASEWSRKNKTTGSSRRSQRVVSQGAAMSAQGGGDVKWKPVWWTSCNGMKGKRVRAIMGAPSKSGITVVIRAFGSNGMTERHVKPKNLEART